MSAPAARASVPASAIASSERGESSTPTMMVAMAGTQGAPPARAIGQKPWRAAGDHGRAPAGPRPAWHARQSELGARRRDVGGLERARPEGEDRQPAGRDRLLAYRLPIARVAAAQAAL